MPDPTDPAASKTIGDDLKSLKTAIDTSTASTAAALAADQQAKADAAQVVTVKGTFAADLKATGDVVEDNGDGTFTAYYTSATAPDGYTTEILRGVSTPVPSATPTPTPDPSPPTT